MHIIVPSITSLYFIFSLLFIYLWNNSKGSRLKLYELFLKITDYSFDMQFGIEY